MQRRAGNEGQVKPGLAPAFPLDRRASTTTARTKVAPKIAQHHVSTSLGSPWATVTSHQIGSTNDITVPVKATARV